MKTVMRTNVKGGQRVPHSNPGDSAAVDRYLCSSAHLAPRFAEYVLTELVEPSVRAASPACGIDLVALARHAKASRARVTKLRLSVAGSLGAALLVLLPAIAFRSAPLLLFAVLIAVTGVHLSVFFDRLSLYRALGDMMSPQVPMRDLAPPLPDQDETRLEALNTSNVIIFEGGNTFVAWGRRIRDGWQISLDATKAATDSSGKKRTVTPFTPADLHKAITMAVRSSGVPNVEAHNRLFVAGHSADAVPGLLPDELNRPASSVPSNSVRLGIEKPRPDIRTYLCVEKTSWGGELAVNHYLRAAMVSGDLFIECHTYVLLPLRAELTAIDYMPAGAAEMTLKAVRDTFGAFKILRGMPHEIRHEQLAARRRRKDLADSLRAIRKQRRVSRGAGLSIRAAAAASERFFLFAYTDEEMHLNALQRRILNAIEVFLDQHGVDTADFHQKQTNIINNSSYAIGAVTGQSVQVGSGNVQNNSNPPPQNDPAPWAPHP